MLRSELIYSRKNNFLIWNEGNYSFFGEDPRGNELKKKISNGITFNRKLFKTLSIKNEFLFTHQQIETNISSQIKRELNSWWEDLELQLKIINNIREAKSIADEIQTSISSKKFRKSKYGGRIWNYN